jgi:hypothetical protein
MDSLFIFLLGLISFFYALFRKPEKAFLDVYLPVLLLIPQFFTGRVLILPQLTTAEITIIPIFIVALATRFSRWRFSFMDLMIAAFIMIKVFSEYSNWGYKEAMNVLAIQLCDVWAPYSLAKLFIIPGKLLVPFAKRMVFLMFIVSVVSIYEMIYIGDLFVMIPERLIFQGQQANWGLYLFRYGLKRINASFAQPILLGIGMSIVIFFNYWLIKGKLWSRSFKFLPIPFVKKSVIIMAFLLLGLIATFSRGPLLSTIVGFTLVGIGYSQSRRRSLMIRLGLLFVVGIMGYNIIQTSLDINKGVAGESAGSAIYRLELLDLYYEPVMQRPWLGWGRTGIPVIEGRKSIDNEYLFSALRNGLLIPALEILIMAILIFRLFRRGLRHNKEYNEDTSFAFCLIGIFIMLGISLFTVYMGLQVEPLFFMLVGLTEGYLHSPPKDFYKNQIESYKVKKPHAVAHS